MDILKKITSLENEASEFGFKWETADQIIAQIQSEISEVQIHLKDTDKTKLKDEIGDLLHAVFSLCVFCKLDPHETLMDTTNKFERRFRVVQELAKGSKLTTLNGQPFDKLMELWDKAKHITGC